MEKKFSVIIPTLFRCPEILNELLDSLYEDDAVSEIILIDNTVFYDVIPNIRFHDKMHMHSAGKNLYVNPSWNYGVELAKEDHIAILNDDITIPNNLFTVLTQANFKDFGIVGACHPMIQQVEAPKRFDVQEAELFPVPERMWGYGIFMAMLKEHYIHIPEEMLVWAGDDYLFHQNKALGRQNYTLVCPIQTKMSATSSDKIFDDIKDNDVIIYETKYKIK